MLRLASCCCLLRRAGPEAGQAALRLYKRAAQQGNVEALLHIGDGYWYGKQGVGRDWRRASQVRKSGRAIDCVAGG
jgi:TPR repeat protein